MSDCDKLERSRVSLKQQRTAAYGDALALARKLEAENAALRDLLKELRQAVHCADVGDWSLLDRIDAALKEKP